MSVNIEILSEFPVQIVATSNAMNIQGNSYHQKLLIDHLRSGNTINFVQAIALGISFLNERIQVLQQEMTVYSRDIRIGNIRCKEYRLVQPNTHP